MVVMLTQLVLLASLLGPVRSDTVGLLVVAHGADSAWNARVHQTMAQVAWRGPVATAFLMGAESGSRSWNTAVQSLVRAGARRIVVVPLMVSTNGSHVRQIEFYAGVRRELPGELAATHTTHQAMVQPAVPVTVTRAIDSAAELGVIMADRWAALSPADRARPLVLVAHGPTAEVDVAPWLTGIRTATQTLATALAPAPLHIGLLRDDAPAPVRAASIGALRDTITALARKDSVVVMTVLISSGSIDRVKIPADLAQLPVKYVGVSLAPHAALARWIERTATASIEGPFSGSRSAGHNHH